ncbi:recombinase family protein [Streptomyces sp. SID625]|nr:recombinase family protein [Streptomyces sp. SID625]
MNEPMEERRVSRDSMVTELIPAIGYIRVNTARVFTDSEGQRKSIEQWAQRSGHLVVDWVEDILVSGEAGRNDLALEELLSRVQKGVAAVVAVDAAYRISRRVEAYRRWNERLVAAGGQLKWALD